MDLSNNEPFCTYLTVYSGNKLPIFYIGSSNINKVLNGYHGTVTSSVYKNVWKQELKENPQLFSTKILTTHKTRKEATEKENVFHLSLGVVKSSLYINMANAVPNGIFGVSMKDNNPGKRSKHRKMMRTNNPNSNPEAKKRLSKRMSVKNPMNNPLHIESMRQAKLNLPKIYCICCQKVYKQKRCLDKHFMGLHQ